MLNVGRAAPLTDMSWRWHWLLHALLVRVVCWVLGVALDVCNGERVAAVASPEADLVSTVMTLDLMNQISHHVFCRYPLI